jgi:hypothetical protein
MANIRGGKALGVVMSDEVLDNVTVNTTATLPAGTTIGGSTVAALGVVTSVSANAVAVGPAGATNPVFNVDASTASAVAGITVIGAATGGTVQINAIDSGANTNLKLSGKGTGFVEIYTQHNGYTPTAINATAVATAAQVLTGYITSTSAAVTAITLPTGTLLGQAFNAVQGDTFELTIDNTAGANTVTMVVAVNGILSAAAAAGSGAGAGLLTIPSGVTGVGVFQIMFTSATAYVFSRVA